MKKHTKEFKSSISTFGRELDSKITVVGTGLILGKEDLFSVTPVTNSTLLKTVMKEVDFESKKQIGIGQEVNIKSGVKVNGEYEYIDYGNYSVYKNEYKAETDTYSHICYDKMLKTMIDYTPLDITYPINLREYITAIATKCGLEFADKNSAFANYNTSINEDHFSNGSYTFRDVLDYIAQLVGGWLCINDNDELKIKYPELAKNYDKVSGENISFISNVEDEINTIIVDGKSTQATRSGKNLFDISKVVSNWNSSTNIGVRNNNDGTLTVSTPSTSSSVLALSPNKLSDYCPSLQVGDVVYLNATTTGKQKYVYLLLSESVWTFGVLRTISQNDLDSAVLWYSSGAGATATISDIMISTSGGEYEPYGVSPSPDYPSEIESVGTYFSLDEETGKYGIEVKNIGKNLFDKDNATTQVGFFRSNGAINSGGSSTITTSYTSILPNTDMTISGFALEWICFYDKNKNFIERVSGKLKTFNKNAYYIRIQASTNVFDLSKIQLEKGPTATEYEPYQSSSSLFVLDQPLRSLPNGVKDLAYIKNNILYVDRKVGSVVLNGSENWTLYTECSNETFKTFSLKVANGKKLKPIKCSHFVVKTGVYNQFLGKEECCYSGTFSGTLGVYISAKSTMASTVDEFKNWLSTHNTQVDYELAEPYTEKIGEVDNLSTFKGINNVSLDSNIQTNMTITYPTDYEELDKHFLKDVNVSFSKKYGAINSVVFSRGGGTDNIYRKDNASINKNGLTEIKIADNPFLEGDDRENFIQSLFDKINGLEFYIMDVASTGIMYLELGDLYYFNMIEDKPSLKSGLVKSGMRKAQGSSGGKFLCLLMNNEVKITQGLEESIYTDEPEITETDYKTASITDTSIKNAIIQTNKNSAEILLKVNSDEVVSAINLSPEKIKISSAKLDIDAIATFTNSKLAEAGSTVINGANITTGSINCDRLNGGTINGQAIRGGSISITTGNYYFNMGTSTSNPNCSGLNVGSYGVKAYSDITATGFAITDSDTGKSGTFILRHSNGTSVVYLTFTGGILTAYDQLD